MNEFFDDIRTQIVTTMEQLKLIKSVEEINALKHYIENYIKENNIELDENNEIIGDEIHSDFVLEMTRLEMYQEEYEKLNNILNEVKKNFILEISENAKYNSNNCIFDEKTSETIIKRCLALAIGKMKTNY